MNFEEFLYEKLEDVATAVFAEKLEILDVDAQYGPRLSQSQAKTWLGIGQTKLDYYISKGMPVVYKENSDAIDFIPRDAVKDFFKNDWRKLA